MQTCRGNAVLLHNRTVRLALWAETQRRPHCERSSRATFHSGRGFGRRLGGLGLVGLFLAATAVVSVGASQVLARMDSAASFEIPKLVRTEGPDPIELAQALTAALNDHDVEALLALFTDEDAGPTVNADRYAWLKSEIALWAEQQVARNIHVSASQYRLTEHGAAWEAEVYRDDWSASGVASLSITNAIWVHDGKLANFTAKLVDQRDAERLADRWQPGATPERPTQ
jgi:hypothetical protein